MSDNKEVFETQDMAFASYLVLCGCSIAAVKRAGRRVIWEFSVDPDKLSEIEAKWPGSESSSFFNTYQTLKGQLRQR